MEVAATLERRSAAADGTSQWITGRDARIDVHSLRATRLALLIGTGTVLADDPRLTVRMPDGSPCERQPLRVVMGRRPVPSGGRIHDGPGEVLHLATRDPNEALKMLWDKGIRDVWLEGGPTLAASFLAAGLVDEVYAYIAPALLGAGRGVVGELGIATMADIARFRTIDVTGIGEDVRIHAVPTPRPLPESR